MSEMQHGTTSMYTAGHCRCATCKKGWAAHYRSYLDRHPEQRAKQNARARARYWRRKGGQP